MLDAGDPTGDSSVQCFLWLAGYHPVLPLVGLIKKKIAVQMDTTLTGGRLVGSQIDHMLLSPLDLLPLMVPNKLP